jgi:hypothetical protein
MTTLGDQRRVPVSRCSSCGTLNNAASAVGEDAGPSPGDATICMACGHIMVFREDLHLREPTIDELIQISSDPRTVLTQRTLHLTQWAWHALAQLRGWRQ